MQKPHIQQRTRSIIRKVLIDLVLEFLKHNIKNMNIGAKDTNKHFITEYADGSGNVKDFKNLSEIKLNNKTYTYHNNLLKVVITSTSGEGTGSFIHGY